MGCCGGRRRARREWLMPRPVLIHYLGKDPIQTVGSVSGQTYEFSSQMPEREVDARDAAELMKSLSFSVVAGPSL
jgi:hypothetical protein